MNQPHCGFGFQLWKMPSLQQCVAEFGPDAGPKLFAGGYRSIEAERSRRKELASKPKPVAAPKPAPVDPRATQLRRLEAQRDELQRCLAMKPEHDALVKERNELQAKIAEQEARKVKPRGIRLSQSGFRPFSRKPAA